MENEKAVGFSMTLQPKEILYMLFGRKACPRCTSKMKRNKRTKIVHSDNISGWTKRSMMGGSGGGHYATPIMTHGPIRVAYFEYECSGCGAQFPLAELVS